MRTSAANNLLDRDPGAKARRKEELRHLVLELLELPVLPALTRRILRISGGQSDAGDMADVISSDRLLAGNILRMANSEYFGLSQKFSGVSRAMKILGRETVKSLALSSLLIEMVAPGGGAMCFNRNRYWAHSLACAYLSKKIAAMTRRAELQTTFVCGLLHDIGKPLVALYFPTSYGRVIERLAAEPLTSVRGEDEMLGFTHAEVGMWLAQRWRFPKAVVFTIANHHGMIARDERYDSQAAILRLADHLCLQERISAEERAFVEPLESAVTEQLRLGRDEVVDLRDALGARKEAFSSLFRDEKGEYL